MIKFITQNGTNVLSLGAQDFKRNEDEITEKIINFIKFLKKLLNISFEYKT